MPAQLLPAGELLAVHQLLPLIRQLHERLREAVVATCEQAAVEELAQVDREGEEDTLYAVDRVGEEELLSFFAGLDPASPIVLVAEGLSGGGQVVLPEGCAAEEALWRIIVDPIDGTRGLMYQKRSAWVLTGVAPNWAADRPARHRVGGADRDPPGQAASVRYPVGRQVRAPRPSASTGSAASATLSPAALHRHYHRPRLCHRGPLLPRRPRVAFGPRRRTGTRCARPAAAGPGRLLRRSVHRQRRPAPRTGRGPRSLCCRSAPADCAPAGPPRPGAPGLQPSLRPVHRTHRAGVVVTDARGGPLRPAGVEGDGPGGLTRSCAPAWKTR